MRQMRSHAVLGLLLTFGISFFATSPSLAGEQVVIAADEWCPYNCKPGSEKPGFMIEITQAALNLKGVDIQYKTLNWSRALHKIRKGNLDGVVGVTVEEADEANLSYGKYPLGMSSFVFVMRKDSNWAFKGIESLSKISFGIIQDYDNGPIISKYMESDPDNVVVKTGQDAFEKNLKLVLANRLDAVIDDSAVVANRLKEMGLTDKTRLVALDKTPLPIFIAFKPGPEGQRLAKLLDEGVDELRRIGWMRDILSRYGLSDWKQDLATLTPDQ